MVYVLFISIILTAAGVFLLLPRIRHTMRGVGLVVTALGIVGVLAGLAGRFLPPDTLRTAMMYVFAILALAAAVLVITSRKPVYSALWFVLVVLAVAGMALLLYAPFLAIALLIIYAGAILVTYLFVIMLAQSEDEQEYDLRARQPFWAVVAGTALTLVLAGIAVWQQPEPALNIAGAPAPDAVAAADQADAVPATTDTAAASDETTASLTNTEQVGVDLFTTYVVALELAGVLLLAAMIGAVVLARTRVKPLDENGVTYEGGWHP